MNEEIKNINENLVNPVLLAPVGDRAWLVQAGADDRGGWAKMKFSEKGQTYLFRPAELSSAMVDARFGARLSQFNHMDALVDRHDAPSDSAPDLDGFEFEKKAREAAATMNSQISSLLEAMSEQADAGMYDMNSTPFGRVFTSDNAPDGAQKFAVNAPDGTFGLWYGGDWDPKKKAHVWKLAPGPLKWYGRPLSAEGDLDDAETSFGGLWPAWGERED